MFPLYDENRSGIIPFVTWLLIAANAAVFFWELVIPLPADKMFRLYGAIPAFILAGKRLDTIFTSMFLHGDFFHILGNMLFLFIFGDNVEARFGHLRFLIAYLIFGVLASYAHAYYNYLIIGAIPSICPPVPDPTPLCVPAIGASGAVSGVLGAYLVLYPSARVVTVVFLFRLFPQLVRIPAFIFLGFWFFLQQVLLGLVSPFAGVAFFAHVGGFIVGVAAGLMARLARP